MTVAADLDRVELLSGGVTDHGVVLAYMEAAEEVVSVNLSATNQPPARLNMIAEHLAAHYVEMSTSGGKTSERLPDYAVTYGKPSDLAELRSTRNGRIAIELDQSGLLGEASKPKPSFAVM